MDFVLTLAYLTCWLFIQSDLVYFVFVSTPIYLVSSYLFYYRSFDSIQDKTFTSLLTNLLLIALLLIIG